VLLEKNFWKLEENIVGQSPGWRDGKSHPDAIEAAVRDESWKLAKSAS